jgi:hypothetical protein
MQLIELLRQYATFMPNDATIFVQEPWSCGSEAILVSPEPDTTDPVERGGLRFEYFLETSVAQEFMEGYLTSVEGATASVTERCERLIRYARDDA